MRDEKLRKYGSSSTGCIAIYSPSSDLIAPVLLKAILSLTAMFDNPLANFNLNKCPNTIAYYEKFIPNE